MPVGNFRNAATYFAARAKGARRPATKARLHDNAIFYDRLASIIPALPGGYKHSESSNGSRLYDRAEECRTLAECCKDRTCRRRLIDLAEEYERLARLRDSAEQ